MKHPLRVRIVGLGGIGSWLCQQVAAEMYTWSIPSELHLIDGDRFTSRNALRQALFYSEYSYKARAVAQSLKNKFKGRIEIQEHTTYLDSGNAYELIGENDIVLACLDNHQSRHLVSIRCQDLNNVALISGGNLEQTGHIIIHQRVDAHDLTPPIHRHHPDIALAKPEPPEAHLGCGEMAGDDEQILSVNIAVANRMYRVFQDIVYGKPTGREIWLDVARGKERVVQ